MGTAKKHRWKLFHKSPPQQSSSVPPEFLCPLSASIMADPVIVSSGHSFDRNCVRACLSLSFTPILPDGAAADFTAVIPNLALKSAILNWCQNTRIDPPKPLDLASAEKIVRNLLPPSPPSEISVNNSPRNGVVSYSSSSSCELENSSPNFPEEFVSKLKSPKMIEQQEALDTLRNLTRTREETRVRLCTPEILASLKTLIRSRYSVLQVNAVAALVNLSIEKQNKVKIVRSGIVPPLINALRHGSPETQDHAAGALFSLSLDNQNKTAIGVLGALPPLLDSLRSDSERTRHDSCLALYHLSTVQSNRVKMIKLGAVQILLTMVKTGNMLCRMVMICCNLAASAEGRAAMLDGGAVEVFVSLLRDSEFESPAMKESCLAAIQGLSYGGLRFKGVAKDAGLEEVLKALEKTVTGSQAKEKVRRILGVLRKKNEEGDEVNWEELLELNDDFCRTESPGSDTIGSGLDLNLSLNLD